MAGLTAGEAPPDGDSIVKSGVRTAHEYGLSAAPPPRSGPAAARRRGGATPGPEGAEKAPDAGSFPGPGKEAARTRLFFELSFEKPSGRGPKNDKKPRHIRLIRLSQGCCFSRLTIRRAEAYIRPIGAPFRKLRLDGAPLKLLTGSVKMPPIVFGSMSFDDAFRCLAGSVTGLSKLEVARSPGCLTSESEERETWTAGSLRAAVA
jgi:hypothetical protein